MFLSWETIWVKTSWVLICTCWCLWAASCFYSEYDWGDRQETSGPPAHPPHNCIPFSLKGRRWLAFCRPFRLFVFLRNTSWVLWSDLVGATVGSARTPSHQKWKAWVPLPYSPGHPNSNDFIVTLVQPFVSELHPNCSSLNSSVQTSAHSWLHCSASHFVLYCT